MNDELINELNILKKDLIAVGYTECNPNVIEVLDDVIDALTTTDEQ